MRETKLDQATISQRELPIHLRSNIIHDVLLQPCTVSLIPDHHRYLNLPRGTSLRSDHPFSV
ncbi:hypothetical protein M404DRAFT_1007749, partial [Pisolithus tinctorius Marx 270]